MDLCLLNQKFSIPMLACSFCEGAAGHALVQWSVVKKSQLGTAHFLPKMHTLTQLGGV